jgi:recombination protein RecA
MVISLTEGEKILAIKKVMDDINKKYGEGTLVKGADARGLKINRLKTGSLTLDIATGGGWAMGKMNEIFGPYSGGKSYVAQLTIAQTQKEYPDMAVALIDFEGAFDEAWAEKIGVDVGSLLISSPEYMEDGLQIALQLIQSGDVALIVIDSLGAACPKAEYDGAMTDFTVGLRARLGNQFARKSKPHVNLLDEEIDLGRTTILIVNQIYSNIGGYGDPDITPGGIQVKHGSQVRVKIRKGDLVQDSDGSLIMQESRFTVEKNKTFPPKKTGAFWFSTQDNPKGKAGQIWRAGEIITYGVLSGVIKRSGAWYYLPESLSKDDEAEKFQGEAKLADFVTNNPDMYLKLEEMVLKELTKIGV